MPARPVAEQGGDEEGAEGLREVARHEASKHGMRAATSEPAALGRWPLRCRVPCDLGGYDYEHGSLRVLVHILAGGQSAAVASTAA